MLLNVISYKCVTISHIEKERHLSKQYGKDLQSPSTSSDMEIHKHVTKMVYYTTVADRLGMVSWSDICHYTGVVNWFKGLIKFDMLKLTFGIIK